MEAPDVVGVGMGDPDPLQRSDIDHALQRNEYLHSVLETRVGAYGIGAAGEVSMPVLVLYGTADSVFPDAPWDALTRDRPNVTYHAFDGVEHGLMGPKVLDEIEAFLNGNA